MSAVFPYGLQPQPPTRPKTTGGKRGPSAPLPLTSSDEEDSDSPLEQHGLVNAPGELTAAGLVSAPASAPNVDQASRFYSGSAVVRCRSKVHPHLAPIGQRSDGRKFETVASTILHADRNKIDHTTTTNKNNNNNNNSSVLNLNHKPCLAGPDSFHESPAAEGDNLKPASKSRSSARTICLVDICTSVQPSCVDNQHANEAATRIQPVPQLQTLENQPWNEASSRIQPIKQTHKLDLLNSSKAVGSGINSRTSATIQPDPTHSLAPGEDPDSATECPLSLPSGNFALEHDHDYESVASPCSSTSSGPIYVRPVGFTHHAQQVQAAPSLRQNSLKKNKLSSDLEAISGVARGQLATTKSKPKREPLPMKCRALPQSFWQQPNVAHQVSPASLCLPPLLTPDPEDAMMEMRPVTPPDENDVIAKVPERKLIVTNTELLLKLFEGIERKKTPNSFKSRAIKVRKLVPKSNTKGLLLGNDPYLVDAVTDKIFPQLTLETSRQLSGKVSLQLITFKEGDKTVALPSLSMEQNYPQMLSELVMHI